MPRSEWLTASEVAIVRKDCTMSRLRLSFTERRRRKLALKVDRLDRLEGRNAVTPIGAAALGLGVIGGMHAMGGG
jgi:hypothetical protein